MHRSIAAYYFFNMTSPHIPASLGAYSIPGVFVTSLQEYGAYVHQWQTYAERVTQELHSLETRNFELKRQNDNLNVQQKILERIVNKQRELISSLEEELERHAIPSTTGLGVPISESDTFESETRPYTTDLLALAEGESSHLADADTEASSKGYDREEEPAAGS
jgi:predicted RNase H-like nuclease (RuvC/YqgF family)